VGGWDGGFVGAGRFELPLNLSNKLPREVQK